MAEGSSAFEEAEPKPDVVETALAEGIMKATEAGRWDIVAQLARELEARRLARSANVVTLDGRRRRPLGAQ